MVTSQSPKFGYFVVGPIVVFIIDRIIGMRQEYRNLQVLQADLLPSGTFSNFIFSFSIS